jgi:DNA-binding Xre family transcriptional regulator
MADIADIGTVRAVFEGDSTKLTAAVAAIGSAMDKGMAHAEKYAAHLQGVGEVSERSAAMQEAAALRQEKAFQREAQQIQPLREIIRLQAEQGRASDMAALRADIEAREIEKVTAARELYNKTMERGKGLTEALEMGGLTIGVGAVVEGFKEMMMSTMETGVQLGKLREQTGISAENLSVLRFAAAESGVEFDTLARGFKKLAVNVYEADSGNKTAAKGFSQLGISVAELRAKGDDMYGILGMVADKFKDLPDGIAKSDAAAKIFGTRMGSEMIPVLNQGSAAMGRFKDEAPIFSDADIERMHSMHESINSLSAAWQRFSLEVTSTVAPAVKTYLSDFAAGLDAILARDRELGAIGDMLTRLHFQPGGRGLWMDQKPATPAPAPTPRPPTPLHPPKTAEEIAAELAAERRAAAEQMEAAREKLEGMKALHAMSYQEEAAYWQQLADHTKRGSLLYRDALLEANKARAGLAKQNLKEWADSVIDVARDQGTQKEASDRITESITDTWDASQKRDEEAAKRLRESATEAFKAATEQQKAAEKLAEERIKLDEASGRISHLQAAQQLQMVHQETFAAWSDSAASLRQQFPDAATPGATEALGTFDRQSAKDKADLDAATAMGALRDETMKLSQAFTELGPQLRQLENGFIASMNDEMAKAITGQKTNWSGAFRGRDRGHKPCLLTPPVWSEYDPCMPGRHLLLHLPDNWNNDRRGDFFENFIGDVLRPMRLAIEKRIRVTGMEIDLLAKGIDQPRKILVECKAQRDALPADVITKLLGNVEIRGADSGWLFSTSDLSKDGRGQWEEIKDQTRLASKFMWFPPERIVSILLDQQTVVDPHTALLKLARNTESFGDATLICAPTGKHWLIEILREGLPASFTVLNAQDGSALDEVQATAVSVLSDRFGALTFQDVRAPGVVIYETPMPPIARVVSGDTWDDLRPARPNDFVGRDDLIRDIFHFVEQVRAGKTATRTFAVQGPSGWGKSSLVIKLVDLVSKGRRITNCSLTAVDSRSATSAAFVSGAVRLALSDAAGSGLLHDSNHDIVSLTHPLDSPDILSAADQLTQKKAVVVLIFDQFEELFTKEALFETFNAIRELSVDLDSKQIPFVLGFAWKTDVSLPQQHPAYHLWHSLADRRKDFRVRQFGAPDIGKVITHAQRQIGISFVPALRTRLIEQCQGYPWLLKKLLVHVAKRLEQAASQYELLERELDVQSLFEEDLAGLASDQIRCLKYVAERAPAYVTDVEEHFKSEIANFLLSKRLLVRSGLNYVIYWDIFRDYLVEGRAPQIPWTRTFQRDPNSAIQAVKCVSQEQPISARRISEILGGSERGWVNVMSDLVALQVVDRIAEDSYRLAPHVKSIMPADLATHIHGQLSRHVVCRELAGIERQAMVTNEILDGLVEKTRPATTPSPVVIHQYAMNLKRWLLFSGHLEERGNFLYRPAGKGSQMGLLKGRKNRGIKFLGTGTPDALLKLLALLAQGNQSGVIEAELIKMGLRNAIYDAVALQLVDRSEDRVLRPVRSLRESVAADQIVRREVLKQPSSAIVAAALRESPNISNLDLGDALRSGLQQDWKPTSGLRYANGVRRYFEWASGSRS